MTETEGLRDDSVGDLEGEGSVWQPFHEFEARWLARLLVALAVPGCTQLQPVEVPTTDRRFAWAPDAANQKDKASGHLPCRAKADLDPECLPLLDDIDRFNGGLGRAMWEMDLRRRELVGKVAEHSNLASIYDTLLWPIGAFFVTKKIRQPSWSAVDTAAVGVATYNVMNSGIPGRDKLYLRAAAQMACAMRVADADLYFDAAEGPNLLAFEQFLVRLNWAASLHRRERDALLADLKLIKPPKGSKGRSDVERERLQALGLVDSPKAPSDPTEEIIGVTEALQVDAATALKRGRKLAQTLNDAGARLRRQRSSIELSLVESLNARAPQPKDPLAAGRELASAVEQAVKAGKSLSQRAEQQAGAATATQWRPVDATLKALSDDSRNQVVKFWAERQLPLREQIDAVRQWITDHDERLVAARADASAMGCDDADLGRFAADLVRRIADAASAPLLPAASAAGARK